MSLLKVSFKNSDGQSLSGRLEFPQNRKPHNFAVFAHCFTCTKNLNAIGNITRSLTEAGFAVLRFDFTGLGDSEGDFADTNFSGNISDLIDACIFLKKKYEAPTLIIGHSLGGTAALYAAAELESIKAVSVIGSPANPAHVKHLLKSSEEEILREGKAVVQLDGRPFTIKKQFLDDLEQKPLRDVIHRFGKSLLILHSPQDKIVGIDNAEEIFLAARHPKSFVSLDGADHLLSTRKDSEYAGHIIAEWANRYLPMPAEPKVSSDHEVAASLDKDEGFTTHMKLGSHSFIADEPKSFGGNDFGPSPYQYYAAALASCTAMTIQMYARHKKWDVANVTVHVTHNKDHAEDCEHCDEKSSKIDMLRRSITFKGDLSTEQTDRLIEIAERCPVHRTMTAQTKIITLKGENQE